MNWIKGLSSSMFVLGVLLLSACTGSGGKITTTISGGDGPPARDIDVSHIPDAVPKREPITRAGNKNPYTVLGKTYALLPVADGYSEVGIGSWYGKKFHGRKTANGETYNMYAMTAAHKTLPIPSYVRVTNLDNNRSAIVRINDRGPFHGGRIIDLSYAAAKKLGYAGAGTTQVKVEVIKPDEYQTNTVERPRVENRTTSSVATAPKNGINGTEVVASRVAMNSVERPPALTTVTTDSYRLPGNTFLQVGAFASLNAAESSQSQVATVTARPTAIREDERMGDKLFRVLIGPFSSAAQLRNIREALIQTESLQPFVVYDSLH